MSREPPPSDGASLGHPAVSGDTLARGGHPPTAGDTATSPDPRPVDPLLRESNYRIRTNLSLLASSLTLQRDALDDPAARDALAAATGQIIAVSQLHGRLTDAPAAPTVDLADYLRALVGELRAALGGRSGPLVAVDAQALLLPADRATRLGMVAAQLVMEAMATASSIEISLRGDAGTIILTVAAPGAAPSPPGSDRIAAALVEQMGGTLERDGDASRAVATLRLSG